MTFLLAPTISQAAESTFHAPQTKAERTLDRILEKNIKENLANTLFNGKTGEPYNPHMAEKYSDIFSVNLQHAWEAAEKSAYPIDMDVISCGDFQEAHTSQFIYRTINSSPGAVTIQATFPDNYFRQFPQSKRPDPFIYKLVKNESRWKIDGIDCGDTYRYNID